MNTRLSRVMRGVGASHLFNTARTWSARFLSLTVVLCAGLMVANAQAAFKAVETFDTLNLADINGQHGWDSDPGSAEVVRDPSGGGNQVLEVLTESGELFKAAKVAAGTTRMLFLRLRFEEHGRYSFGLSFASNPTEYIDFQPELGMAAATTSDPGNDLRVANGLGTEIYDELKKLVPGIWYNVWVLVNNDSETYEVWLNSNPGGSANKAGDQLSNDAAETLFGFRKTPGRDLQNFFIKTGGGDSPADGRFYIDDIYLENTSSVNLSNPTDGDTDPVDPVPTDPVVPTEPEPTDPVPTDPVVPTDPEPTDPVPTDPEPSDPLPTAGDTGFEAVETFDSLNLADINGQNGWDSDPGSAEVVLDPSGSSNQVLKVLTESGELFKAAKVAAGTTRMLFLRLRFEEHGRYSFGLSFASNPTEYIDFQPELGMAATTASDPSNDLRVANGLSTEIYDVLTALAPGTWYNIWVLVDNSSERYEVWLNAEPGGDAQAGDQLSNDAAETLFGFRTAPGTDLKNFFIKTGGGDSPASGLFYLDDIYLETTDGVNLSNPLGGVDSNGDGISDADASALGLDPNDPDGDTDDDAATDVDETGGDPSNPLPVDSDGDGVIDALEPGLSATDAGVASGLTLSSGDSMTITTAAGEMLSEVSTDSASGGPTGINFPFGTISYTTTSPVGGSVTVRMAFTADLPSPLVLYKENNGVFTELPASTWSLVDPATVDITLTDGDPLTDLDPVAGSIKDPVAPAEAVPLTSTSGGGGGGGCVLNTAARQDRDPIFPLLMLALLGYGFRRRWC